MWQKIITVTVENQLSVYAYVHLCLSYIFNLIWSWFFCKLTLLTNNLTLYYSFVFFKLNHPLLLYWKFIINGVLVAVLVSCRNSEIERVRLLTYELITSLFSLIASEPLVWSESWVPRCGWIVCEVVNLNLNDDYTSFNGSTCQFQLTRTAKRVKT